MRPHSARRHDRVAPQARGPRGRGTPEEPLVTPSSLWTPRPCLVSFPLCVQHPSSAGQMTSVPEMFVPGIKGESL